MFRAWHDRCIEAASGKDYESQESALLKAFKSIESPLLREQIAVLVEIIAQNPLLQSRGLLAEVLLQ